MPVEQAEKVAVRLDADGRLRQPCACFNGACTIHADRPAACQKFDCCGLQTVQAGRRDVTWAHGQIAAMRNILAALNAALPGPEPSIYRRAALFLARHQDDLRDPAIQRKPRQLWQCLADCEAALVRFHVADTKNMGG